MGCGTCVFYPPSACDGKPCCACDTDDALFNCYQPACEKDGADTRKRVDKDIHLVPKGGSTKW